MSNAFDEKFLTELYGNDNDDEDELDQDDGVEEEYDNEDDAVNQCYRSPTPPPMSPLTPPERRPARSSVYRDRSRSPVWNQRETDPLTSSDVVITLLPVGDCQTEFITPDAHSLYEITEDMEVVLINSVTDDQNESSVVDDRGVIEDRNDRDVRARSVRGRVRGGRGRISGCGRRGRGVGGGRRRRGAAGPNTWEVGHPLEEIWMTDDDVPLELREMAMDIVRKRQTGTQANANVNRSIRELRNKLIEEDDRESEDEDEFEDATDGRGSSLLEGVLPHFEWSTMESFRGKEETFKPKRTGSVESYSSPYDAFRSYWDDSIIQLIVEETNRYASKIKSITFQSEWYPTNSHEILCMFAFWMMLGIIRMPTVVSCFSTNPLLKTEIFRKIFTFNRYCNLVKALHFVNNDSSYDDAFPSNSGTTANSDRLQNLRPIIDHLNAKFQANYVLSQDICIDESLTLWKGRLNIRQYIRSKAVKCGIKTFELCESATGYLWSFLVYSGKHNTFELEQDSTSLKSTAIVKKLITPLLNKGYRLFMDNWYNCPLLARYLKRNGTDCVGTLRSSCRDVPYIIKKAPLKQGQLIARHAGDICVLSWQDKNRVTMISTCHGSAVGLPTVPSNPLVRPVPFKPQVVLDYNKSMGGVDLKDQMLEPYLLERKRCAKWYMKLFKRLLNCSILNARTLLQSSLQMPMDHLQFRLQLVDSILVNHLSHSPLTRRMANDSTATLRYAHPARVPNHKHWPVRIPPSASREASNRQGRGNCVVCLSQNRKSRKSPFKCETCNVPLCVENCFRIYHTV